MSEGEMSDRPETAAEARALMLDWAEGRRSWTNVIMDAEPRDRLGPTDGARQITNVRIEEADAATAAKWAAVYAALAQVESTAVKEDHLEKIRNTLLASSLQWERIADALEGLVLFNCGRDWSGPEDMRGALGKIEHQIKQRWTTDA